MIRCLLLVFLLPFLPAFSQPSPSPELWYKQPASEWLEALPVGNGRLGAMVFGGYQQERIQINAESVWAGMHFNDNNPNSLQVLDTVRQLLFEIGRASCRERVCQFV